MRITEKTAEGLSPGYRENIQENEILGVDVYQTDKLEEKAVSMAKKAGISEEQVFVNLAYNQVNQEKTEEKLRSYVIFALFALGQDFSCCTVFFWCRQRTESSRWLL